MEAKDFEIGDRVELRKRTTELAEVERLDPTNPANSCEVDGVKYVACKPHTCEFECCSGCYAEEAGLSCFAECHGKIWRPASEFGPSEIDTLCELAKKHMWVNNGPKQLSVES